MRKETEQLQKARREVPLLRVIESEQVMTALVVNYFKGIRENDFSVVPSKTALAEWAEIPFSTLRRAFDELYPECNILYNEYFADTMMEGAILGKYRDAPSIFTTKNRVGWTDRKEITTNSNPKGTAQDVQEAEEALKALGYIKASNVIEVEDAIKKNKSKNNPKSKASN